LDVRDWPVMWRKSCRRQRCRPDDLRLEVTESSLMSNADAALETMQDLQTRWA
jgi:EAL domain-containing protein (putative c-di-GMP-specific phosphodiesterase class I)